MVAYMLTNIKVISLLDSVNSIDDVTQIYVQLDTVDSEPQEHIIQQSDYIEQAITYINQIELSYQGGYSSIPYGNDGTIILMQINNRDNAIYLTDQGYLYTKTSKYSIKGKNSNCLYNYLFNLFEVDMAR